MAGPTKNRCRKKLSGARVAALVILLFVFGSVAGYYLFAPAKTTGVTSRKPPLSTAKSVISAASVPLKVIPPAPAAPLSLPNEQSDSPQPVAPPKTEENMLPLKTSCRLAIIIDDMGGSLSEARSLAAIKVPLTFAIIPGLRVDKDVAAYATSNGIETMIHIPMQSKGWPERRLEENGLLVAMGTVELQERVAGFLQRFPGAMGANNHMGSEFTEHEQQMEVVLQLLKSKNMFFIDSVTSPESAGLKVAHRLGIKSARRTVFLDNEQERNYILGQLKQAVRLARKNGTAIAICHPHSATIAALAASLPELAGQGVSLVRASQLVM